MQPEIKLSAQSELDYSLKNKEAKQRLCTFIDVLIKINSRENLVKQDHENNKHTGNTSKS